MEHRDLSSSQCQSYSEATYENTSFRPLNSSFGDSDLSALSLENIPHSHIEGYNKLSVTEAIGSHEHSSDSSAGTSPKPATHGNRVRALSLNHKASHGRSTAHITQQQINKKRQRASPEQLIVLEDEFTSNPSPNAKMRELISKQIDMTERSVQIWFQNRYGCPAGFEI